MRALVVSLLAAVVLAGASGADALVRQAPAGGPVPAHTSATSATFVSTQQAFVLGTAPCIHHPCSVILRTLDRGHSWVGLPAPLEGVSRMGGSGLWGLRFADPLRGYAYGNGIWRTLDGASSWQRWSVPGRYVLDFAAVRDQRLIAVTTSCSFSSGGCSPRLTLYERPITGGAWRAIARSRPNGFNESLSVHGAVVWVLLGQRLVISTDGGRTFRAHAEPCAHSNAALPQPTSISDGGAATFLLCTGQAFTGHTIKFIYRTHGTSGHWTRVGQAPTPGDGGLLAAAGHGRLVIATASAASWLYRSTDGGRHWRTPVSFFDGGEGWADLGFTTGSDGVVIHGPASRDGGSATFPGQLLLTGDAGHIWRVVPF
jgi:hypothetical protein